MKNLEIKLWLLLITPPLVSFKLNESLKCSISSFSLDAVVAIVATTVVAPYGVIAAATFHNIRYRLILGSRFAELQPVLQWPAPLWRQPGEQVCRGMVRDIQ